MEYEPLPEVKIVEVMPIERIIFHPNVCSVCKKESLLEIFDFDHRELFVLVF